MFFRRGRRHTSSKKCLYFKEVKVWFSLTEESVISEQCDKTRGDENMNAF